MFTAQAALSASLCILLALLLSKPFWKAKAGASGWILLAAVIGAELALLCGLKGEAFDPASKILGPLSGVLLLAAVALRLPAPENGGQGTRLLSPRVGIAVTAITTAALGSFLFLTLETYMILPLTWEDPVLRAFGSLIDRRVGFARILLDGLRWDDGLVSSSEKSFLYGTTTWLIIRFFSVSLWNLRIVSLALTLLSVPLVYRIGSRFLGGRIGWIASVLFLCNPAVLYYSRYGSSLAATIFLLLLSLYFTLDFLADMRPKWWKGTLTAFCFYLCSLHYSPARLCLMIFAAYMLLSLLWNRRSLTRQKVAWFCVFSLCVAGVFLAEDRFEAARNFLHARGEQIFEMVNSPDFVRDQIGERKAFPMLDEAQKRLLVKKIIWKNIYGFAGVFSPLFGFPDSWGGSTAIGDPPHIPLYYPALLPFILWAFLVLGLKSREDSWRLLMIWTVLVCGVLLLTTRVDIHRAYVLVIPLSFFSAWGLSDFLGRLFPMESKSHLKPVAALVFVCVLAAFPLALLRDTEGNSVPKYARELSYFMETQTRPVNLGLEGDHCINGWLEMAAVEKNRLLPYADNRVLNTPLYEKFPDSSFVAAEALSFIRNAERSRNTIFVFGPVASFSKLKKTLADNKCDLEERKFGDMKAMIVNNCATP